MSYEDGSGVINEQFVIEEEIGKGSFAVVYKGHLIVTDACVTNKTFGSNKNYQNNNSNNNNNIDNNDVNNNNNTVAIKIVPKSKLNNNQKLLENLEIEISILKKIKHNHIVSLIDCQRTSNNFYLIMEYCSIGDLTILIKRNIHNNNNNKTSYDKTNITKDRDILLSKIFQHYPSPNPKYNGLNIALILNYLQQLSSALQFLRSKNLVHRDIKPQNLLLTNPFINYNNSKEFHRLGYVGIYNLPVLKIADFGFARFLPNHSLAETLCGSPLYMAPEILNYEKYNAKADLWSLGIVLFEMGSGHPPFKASNHLELYKRIKKLALDNSNSNSSNSIIVSGNRGRSKMVQFPDYFSTNYISNVQLDNDLKNLICRLLTFDPKERITFEEFFSNRLLNMDLSQYETVDFDLNPLENNVTKGSSQKNSFNRPSNVESSLSDVTNLQNNLTAKADGNNNNNNNLDNDLMFEKDYVVVEKNTIEVNKLADELAQLNTRNGNHNLLTLTNIKNNNGNNLNQIKSRRSSFNERLGSINVLNPSNALSKALGIASTRIFGNKQCIHKHPPLNRQNVDVPIFNEELFKNIEDNILLNVRDENSNNNNNKSGYGTGSSTEIEAYSHNVIINKLEKLSAKAFVVYTYAEVKFEQLLPLSLNGSSKRFNTGSVLLSSEDDELYRQYQNEHSNNSNNNTRERSYTRLMDNIAITPESRVVCKEAITLYVKVLELLSKSMEITSKWWYESNEGFCSLKLNLLVQWIRDKFNECLEKAELLRTRLCESLNKENLSIDDIETVYVEKLLYDRALEISKNATNMELNGINLNCCQLSYAASVWMLQTILDNNINNDILDDQNKIIIQKYIDGILNRLKLLRNKANNQT